MRVGLGYDVHKLVDGRELILGGVDIPYEKGLLGHSDADVLLHAIMDALAWSGGTWRYRKTFSGYRSERTKVLPSLELLKQVGNV